MERGIDNAALKDDEECTDFNESLQTNVSPKENRLEKCLLLCVPYACSIGGIGSVRTFSLKKQIRKIIIFDAI